MAGVALRVEASGIAEVSAAIARLGRASENLAPFFENVGASLVASTLDRFEKGHGPDGIGWTPSRRALEQNGRTLVDSGRLRTSITYRADAKQVSVGTNVIYAAIHQFGGNAGRGGSARIPARPYLGLSTEDRTEIFALVEDHLRGALG